MNIFRKYGIAISSFPPELSRLSFLLHRPENSRRYFMAIFSEYVFARNAEENMP